LIGKTAISFCEILLLTEKLLLNFQVTVYEFLRRCKKIEQDEYVFLLNVRNILDRGFSNLLEINYYGGKFICD